MNHERLRGVRFVPNKEHFKPRLDPVWSINVELLCIHVDSTPTTHERERALMDAMLEEASDGWEEIFGAEARPAEKSQDDTPTGTP